ncbi:DedA family protein [Desulforegula conservatrix]|uniref:DedA family protein n=1 Tax=Desulforegula conservatrix TaxID=153026 RepID=UPI00040BF593|nr:DedA family protein [Desulforegula conservatrix]
MTIEQLVTYYGYPAILLGTFLEGETVLVLAGFLAHQGYLELPFVILAAFVGTLFGDQLYYYIGRIKGRSFIDKRPGWKKRSGRILNLLQRHQILLILGFRFIYGIRTVTPFIVGMSRVKPLHFLILNVIGAGVWAITVGLLGYVLGHSLELLIAEIKHYEIFVIAVVVLVGSVVWIFMRLRDRNSG